MSQDQQTSTPKDGIAGLKRHFRIDITSGFIVFLLALPLSLGIAQASDFPPAMGLVTAIIGGLLVAPLAGSRLTIKGPAAGLIVVVASSVADFGGGATGWHLALGAMVVAGLLQTLFGLFKLGKFIEFFPVPAIHGMMAAIGLVIITRQIPVLVGVNATLTHGKAPLELLLLIPDFFQKLNPHTTLIGMMCFIIMVTWPSNSYGLIGKIPPALLVVLFAISAQLYLSRHYAASISLVHLGNITNQIGINARLGGIHQPITFLKYVIMFALIGTIESLLTVKAIDMRDPYRRRSDPNKDIIAVGIGNIASAILGGMPMISEVARSSSNVANGAKTRWANFFHGLFIFIFVIATGHILEMIPNAAFAAMLLAIGIRLAHPKEFVHMYEIGKEQLAIFLTTIVFTLGEDLLVGMAAGIILSFLFLLFHRVSIRDFLKSSVTVHQTGTDYRVIIERAAVFSNLTWIKPKLDLIPNRAVVTIDVSNAYMIDHSVMEALFHFEHDYKRGGGTVYLVGLEEHEPLTNHKLAARKKIIVPATE